MVTAWYNCVTENGLKEFNNTIGCADDFTLADALWFCSSTFSKWFVYIIKI